MDAPLLSLLMNGTIIVLLLATIIYSARLSRGIRVFKDSRKDLEKLVRDLGQQIARADEAVAGMRNSARDAGKDMQAKISDCKRLQDELDVMIQSGNSLAARLEKAVDRGLPDAGRAGGERAKSPALAAPKPANPSAKPLVKPLVKPLGKPVLSRAKRLKPREPEISQAPELKSQAERELYDALNKRRKPDDGEQG